MAAHHSPEPAGLEIFPNARIAEMNHCDTAGRDIVNQQGANFIGRDNVVGNTIVLGNPNSADPIQRLLFYCALDALVDSKERHDSEQFLPPRCAPETRDAVLRSILCWIKQGLDVPAFLWLTGSAGSGKSAICQTIAEIYQREGTLLANFFFSRGASSSGRSNGYRLIPTLIWQIQKNLPETTSQIKRVITNNTSILTSTLTTQMETLFCAPLKQKSLRRWLRELGKKQIRLIVIDGLDECQGSALQSDLLHAIANTVTQLALPLRIVIASRPEAHIMRTLHMHPSLKVAAEGRIDLDEIDDATAGIYSFVRARFREIHKTHPLAEHLDPSWPSEKSIIFIVSKSSPQFIFASTVMNYVSFPDARPDQRLSAIISMATTEAEDSSEDPPFENLDKLYRFIFSGVKAEFRPSVWMMLGFIHLAGRQEFAVPMTTSVFFEGLFGVPPGQVGIMLVPLLSVIAIPVDRRRSPITSLHASLFDFLLDPLRSKDLVLDLIPVHSRLLDYYDSLAQRQEIYGLPWLFLGVLRHATMLPAPKNHRPVIDRLTIGMLSSLDGLLQGYFSSSDMADAICFFQFALDLLKGSEQVNEEEFDHRRLRQLSWYEPLGAICLPASIQNPFASPISRFKYCAFVSLARSYSCLGGHTLWYLLDLSSPVLGDMETLMHLIPAFAIVTAKSICGLDDAQGYLTEGLEKLVTIGYSFVSSERNYNWEEEPLTICRKSVIDLCNCVHNTPNIADELVIATQKTCVVWTRLGEQTNNSSSN